MQFQTMIKHSLQFLFILLFAFCIAACSTDKVELEDTIENGGQTQPGETNEEEQQEHPADGGFKRLIFLILFHKCCPHDRPERSGRDARPPLPWVFSWQQLRRQLR